MHDSAHDCCAGQPLSKLPVRTQWVQTWATFTGTMSGHFWRAMLMAHDSSGMSMRDALICQPDECSEATHFDAVCTQFRMHVWQHERTGVRLRQPLHLLAMPRTAGHAEVSRVTLVSGLCNPVVLLSAV